MAGIFDLALWYRRLLVFVLVFVACTAHPPTGKPAMFAAGLVLGGFFLYQYLFFKYAEGTPGMRYAKIALCTFEDENPTRKAMCRRVLFLLLSSLRWGWGLPGLCSTRIASHGMTACRGSTSESLLLTRTRIGGWPSIRKKLCQGRKYPERCGAPLFFAIREEWDRDLGYHR